jgi:hypothetical protein
MSNTWRQCLDEFFYFRQRLAELVTFLSIHIFGSEVSWEEIRRGKLNSAPHVNRNLDGALDLDLLLTEARSRAAEAEARRSSTTDKCKTLLTLSSLVLTASGVILSKASFEETWVRVILLLAILFLLHVVILISMHFAVGTEMRPSLDQEDARLSGADLRKSLINIYLRCQADKDARVDFLVEIYKVARFFFLIGLSLLIVVISSSLPKKGEILERRVADELIKDPRFTEIIRERLREEPGKPDPGQSERSGLAPANSNPNARGSEERFFGNSNGSISNRKDGSGSSLVLQWKLEPPMGAINSPLLRPKIQELTFSEIRIDSKKGQGNFIFLKP